jgi:pyrroline-5-carboxylate reductase
MNIGIIGIGNLGLDLLTSIAEKPHEIYVSEIGRASCRERV